MSKRKIAACFLLAAAGWMYRPGVYTATGSSAAAVVSVRTVSATRPFIWGGERPTGRPCFVPWLSSYMGGNTRPILRMLRCAEQMYPVRGGLDKVMRVVDCESKFNPFAVSDSGRHIGLFQHDQRYWMTRWHKWSLDRMPKNPTNAWANIMVSMRIIHFYGWSAWSCA